jgi:hypothetical protein
MHTDKELSEVNAIRKSFPETKHQLCMYHGINYVTERLTQNKPTAKYNAQLAHDVYDWIDPLWSPKSTETADDEYTRAESTSGCIHPQTAEMLAEEEEETRKVCLTIKAMIVKPNMIS